MIILKWSLGKEGSIHLVHASVNSNEYSGNFLAIRAYYLLTCPEVTLLRWKEYNQRFDSYPPGRRKILSNGKLTFNVTPKINFMYWEVT